MLFPIILSTSLAALALARTDLTGCTSTDVSSPAGASVAWYVPDTGELCDFLDCGGGRAPPKTTVPGCPLYSGTATYSPSYLPGFGSMTQAASTLTASPTSAAMVVPPLMPVSPPHSSSETTVTGMTTAASASGISTTSTVTSSPTAGLQGNGTAHAGVAGSNGTASSPASPSLSQPASQTTNGAMSTARVGVAGLVGLGALLAML